MTSARYRAPGEVHASNVALEVLRHLDTLKAMAAVDDPLALAALVAERTLRLALHTSPIAEIAEPVTVLESGLPHGPNALEVAERDTPRLRRKLEEIHARAFDLSVGPAVERAELVRLVVHAGYELVAELTADAESADYLSALIEAREAEPLRAVPLRLPPIAWEVVARFAGHYGKAPDLARVYPAVIAAAQDAHRPGRPGAPRKGALNLLDELEGLVLSVSIEPPARGTLREAIRDDVSEARASARNHIWGRAITSAFLALQERVSQSTFSLGDSARK